MLGFFFQFRKNCTTCLYFEYAAFCTVFNSQSCFALVPGDGSIIEGSGTSGGEGVFCACQPFFYRNDASWGAADLVHG